MWDGLFCREKQPEKEKSYYQSVHGVVIVFNLTDKQSFDKVTLYHDKAKTWSPEAFVFLMGNKCDLNDERIIRQEDALATASKLGVEYFEVNAKDYTDLTDPFNKICATLMKLKDTGVRERAWWKKKQPTF